MLNVGLVDPSLNFNGYNTLERSVQKNTSAQPLKTHKHKQTLLCMRVRELLVHIHK